jgi:hypothetical protein
VSGMLNYWSPGVAAPARVLPPARNGPELGERVDLLTMTVVVCSATAGAFCIVIAMAWVMGA